MHRTTISQRTILLSAASVIGLAISAPAAAQDRPTGAEESPAIIANNNLNPNTGPAGGVLDSGITGIGQQIAFVQASPTAAGLSLCTGTLINPRTVIFAAHCVNTRPAHMYGSETGTGGGVNGAFGAITSVGTTTVTRATITSQGVPFSFGFGERNRCTGTTPGVNAGTATAPTAGNGCQAETGAYEVWRNSGFVTNTDLSIYNVNQIWWDPRSVGPNSNGFIHGDIALATLDTPAFDVPTWTMLFTPLSGPTHSLSIGYGVSGTSATGQGTTPCVEAQPGPPPVPAQCGVLGPIDYRRRMVENTLSALGSLQDRNAFLFGPDSAGLNHQSLYMQDFDSPAGPAAYTGTFNNYDFDIFTGAALPNEGTTAGGDSGGPLVVDQLFDRPVTIATLSGGSRFLNGQRFSTYGTHNFYQPLFLFWDAIVANNPYVYAGAKAGDGAWEDPDHWVQLMDPSYAIEVNGQLVNSLPDTPALGVSGNTVKFGEICFIDQGQRFCTNLANDDTATPPPGGNGTPIVIAGGPGSTNFVPDNVEPVNSADATQHVRARYYDVTLSEAGTTTLSSARTIDVLTLDGNATKLKIANGGSLDVFGEVTQLQGWTQVDGLLKSGRDTFIATGLLSGSGTIEAPFVTVADAVVAAGGGDVIGTLTIDGDMILSSASSLFVDVRRNGSDLLDVTGELALNGGSVVFNKVTDAAPPRHGETRTIAHADGGVDGTFGSAYTFQGVLRPHLIYTANDVKAEFRAGSLVEILDGGSAVEIAFASALDQLRSNSYAQLWNLYGEIDWMNGSQLSAALSSLSPRIIGDVSAIHEHQSKLLMSPVTDRLSVLGSGTARGLTISGSPMAGLAARNASPGQMSFGGGSTGKAVLDALPNGITGFVSGGIERLRSSYGDQNYAAGDGAWHMAMGLEMPLGDVRIGTAAGYAEGVSGPGGDSNRSRTSMAAAYAAMPLGSGVYVGGLVSAEMARAAVERGSHDGVSTLRLSGATRAVRYSAVAEVGKVAEIGAGLSLTPRAQLSFGHYKLDGFTETGGETALRIEDLKLNRIEARLGAKLEGSTRVAGLAVSPQVSADYVSLLSGRRIDATVRFASAPDHAFELPLGSSASGWLEVKGGVSIGDGPVTLGLTGQRAVGVSELSDDRAQAELKVRF